jgi:basic membrane protein A
MQRPSRALLGVLFAFALLATACGKSSDTSPGSTSASSSKAPGTGGTAIGFIMIGPKDDYGYNQAVYEGSQAVGKANPSLKILTAENVPETPDAERPMEDMISQGAKIIFATSYGHLAAAEAVAARHPDVVVVHQGGLTTDPLANFGTFFGTVYEPVYLAGIAAGATTKTNKLGYVVALPIPQTLENVNAFQLGAKSVNPAVTTTVVFTSAWCDPAKQAEAAKSLLDQGIDVLTQHQDCTKTIVETAEAAGAYSVGYHHDASVLAPNGWITGSEWNWDPLYNDIVSTALAGKFTGSKYNADFRVGLRSGDNPFVQSAYGSMVSADTKAKVEAAKKSFVGGGSPFTGPIVAQNGDIKIPTGTTPDYAAIETMDYLVQGVVGTLPK